MAAAGLLLLLASATPGSAQVGPPPVQVRSLALTGAEEVPAVTTTAEATFYWRSTGTGIETEIVALGDDFTMAHFHLGAKGTNGPVVAFLFGPVDGGQSAVHSTKTVTAADLVGPLAGMTLNDLKKEIAAGNIYVNLHSVTNPAGVLRAQVPVDAAPIAPSAPNTGSGTTAGDGFGAQELAFALLALAAGAAVLMVARRRS